MLYLVTKHQCKEGFSDNSLKHDKVTESPDDLLKDKLNSAGEAQQKHVSFLETRTTNLEHNMALLNARFESLMLLSHSIPQSKAEPLKTPSFICEVCDDEFRDKEHLLRHKSYHHDKKSFAEDISGRVPDFETFDLNTFDDYSQVLVCKKCQFTTQYEDTLAEHKRSSHQSTRYFYSSTRHVKKKTQSSSKQHKETVSKKPEPPIFFNSNNKASDRQVDANGINCETCDKTFEHKDEFALHEAYYHNNSGSKNE